MLLYYTKLSRSKTPAGSANVFSLLCAAQRSSAGGCSSRGTEEDEEEELEHSPVFPCMALLLLSSRADTASDRVTLRPLMTDLTDANAVMAAIRAGRASVSPHCASDRWFSLPGQIKLRHSAD